MSVTVVVVNWNGKQLLSECLGSLLEQVYQPITVTLVDNGSNDGSVDFVETLIGQEYKSPLKEVNLINK